MKYRHTPMSAGQTLACAIFLCEILPRPHVRREILPRAPGCPPRTWGHDDISSRNIAYIRVCPSKYRGTAIFHRVCPRLPPSIRGWGRPDRQAADAQEAGSPPGAGGGPWPADVCVSPAARPVTCPLHLARNQRAPCEAGTGWGFYTDVSQMAIFHREILCTLMFVLKYSCEAVFCREKLGPLPAAPGGVAHAKPRGQWQPCLRGATPQDLRTPPAGQFWQLQPLTKRFGGPHDRPPQPRQGRPAPPHRESRPVHVGPPAAPVFQRPQALVKRGRRPL